MKVYQYIFYYENEQRFVHMESTNFQALAKEAWKQYQQDLKWHYDPMYDYHVAHNYEEFLKDDVLVIANQNCDNVEIRRFEIEPKDTVTRGELT